MDEKEINNPPPPDPKEWERISRELLVTTANIMGTPSACRALLDWGDAKVKEGLNVEYYYNKRGYGVCGYIRKDPGSKDACHKA